MCLIPLELGEASGAMLSSNALQHKRMDSKNRAEQRSSNLLVAYRFKGVSYFASTYTNTTVSVYFNHFTTIINVPFCFFFLSNQIHINPRHRLKL